MSHPPELRQEALRLRTEELLGLSAISSRLGISKGTASLWLRGTPLPSGVGKGRMVRAGRTSFLGNKKPRGVESEVHRVVREHQLGSVQVGKVAETAVLLRLLMRGLNPFGSVFDGDKTDWLVEVPSTGKVWKVQVKSTSKPAKYGLPCVPLRWGHSRKGGSRPYKPGDFDILVGYDLYTDTCYVWVWSEIHSQHVVAVSTSTMERWDKFLLG